MSLDWWQLPGARRFINQVIEDLRAEKNLVLCLPAHAPRPADWRQSLSEIWRGSDELSIIIDLRDDERDWQKPPLWVLKDRFASNSGETQSFTIDNLLENQSMANSVIWIDGLNAQNHTNWTGFLRKYEQRTRNAEFAFSPPLFVLTLENELALQPPKSEINLSIRQWRGVLDSFDALMYAASLYRVGNTSDLQHRIAVATIANLAVWDWRLAERFADEKFETLIEPREMLISLRSEFNWCDARAHEWHAGMIDNFDNESCCHSALLAESETLARRLWKAQIPVVLPFVEERRCRLLDRHRHDLSVWMRNFTPVDSEGTLITDIYDLEIGNLSYLFGRAGVKPPLRQFVEDLRFLRNELAHLRPLTANTLLQIRNS